MKAEIMSSDYGPFGVSLIPEDDKDREIVRKFVNEGIRITGIDTATDWRIIIETKLKKGTESKEEFGKLLANMKSRFQNMKK